MNFVRLHQPRLRERFPRNGLHPEVCYFATLFVTVIRLARSWVMGTLVRKILCFPLRTPTMIAKIDLIDKNAEIMGLSAHDYTQQKELRA